MKKFIIVIIGFLTLVGCKECPIRGGFPEKITDPNTSPNRPTNGCKVDLTTNFKNNCNIKLYVFYLEIDPGAFIKCEELQYGGELSPNQSKQYIIHKGKLGYFVFAEALDAKCTDSQIKSLKWVDCSNSTSNTGFFDTCY